MSKPKTKPTISAATPRSPSAQDTAEGERLCPFRAGSKYAAVWLALWRHRRAGISRTALIDEVAASNPNIADRTALDYAVTIVTSPRQDGGSHRSADRAADLYFVEKSSGGNMVLHLRNEACR